MSSSFSVRTASVVPRSVIDSGPPDLRWSDKKAPDPLDDGRWEIFRDRISTRLTTVEWAASIMTVTIRAGACMEDCNLALDIVRRAAASGDDGRIDTDSGELTVAELDTVFDDAWKRRQIASLPGILTELASERGPVAMPGPVRNVWIGPRSVAELEAGDPSTAADRLVALMRRVQWPDLRYEAAGEFTSEGGGEPFTLAMLLPDRACVLPKTDRLGVVDSGGAFMIPRSALRELPVEVVDLDDGNQLVEAIGPSDWPELCRQARRYEIPR